MSMGKIILSAVYTGEFFGLLACGGGGGSSDSSGRLTMVDPANIDPALFVRQVDNPLFPLTPGTTYVTEGDEGAVIVVNEVTSQTRVIQGVTTTVVLAREYEDGELVEDTQDWFAQDIEGNVWYFGEDTKEIEDGAVVTTSGSFEAGVNGAQAGIIMLANPQVGQSYAQESFPGQAEDQAAVIAVNLPVTVEFGSFTGCLQTRETTPLEPGEAEDKFHCPGVGFVQAVKVQSNDPEKIGSGEELVEIRTGPFTPEFGGDDGDEEE